MINSHLESHRRLQGRKLLSRLATGEAGASADEKLLYKACEIAHLAGQLLMGSGALLDRALAACAVGTALAFQVTETIASLKQKLGTESSLHFLHSNTLDDLAEVTSAAYAAARLSASASLDIRKMIGGPDSPANRYLWSTQPTSATLVDFEEHLRQLAAQATLAVKTWTAHQEEMATIQSGILSMLEVATRNTAVARDAAKAAEHLHIQAINFVRMVERSGVLLPRGLE